MNKTINLLPQKSAGYIKKRKLISYLRMGSFLMLFAVFVFSISTFLINKYYSPDSLEREEIQASRELSSMNDKMIKYAYTEDRLSDIKTIIDKRPLLDKKVLEITKQVPAGIAVNNVSIDRENVFLTLSSNSLLISEKLLDAFNDLAENKKLFKSFSIDGISINPTGRHSLSIRATLL